MADINIDWFKTENPISILEYAQEVGFDLRALNYEGIRQDKWEWIDTKIRLSILNNLSDEWDEDSNHTTNFSKVKQGVYVITLGENISIDYNGKPSQVMYIGRGKLNRRISSHLKHWIKIFSASLQDISFNVWLTEVKVKGSPNAYKNLESDLINYFERKYGVIPLNNLKNGDYHSREHNYNNEWKKPLINPRNIHSGWCIKPLKNNEWFKKGNF